VSTRFKKLKHLKPLLNRRSFVRRFENARRSVCQCQSRNHWYYPHLLLHHGHRCVL